MQWALSRFFALTALAVSGFLAGCGGCAGGCGGEGLAADPPVVAPPPPPAVVTQTFAYVAARGLESVAIYRIEADGTLVSVDTVLSGERVAHVAIHPSGRFAYAVNRNDDNVSIFALDPATGRLSNRVLVAAGISPRLIRIHPSGHFAYVTNFADGSVSIFSIDTVTGALTAHPDGPVAVGAQPSGIMIDATGQFAFVESADGVQSYSIGATGALNPNSTVPLALTLDDIALAPSGRFLYAATADGKVSMHSVSATGQIGPSTEVTVGGIGQQSIYIEPRGRFAYVTNSGDDTVAAFGLHPQTGELIPAGAVNPGMDPHAVAMDPTGEHLYVTCESGGSISMYSVDQTTGALSPVGTPLLADILPGGITIVSLPH